VQITLNGQQVILETSCSVQQLLEKRGLHRSPCAVEDNRELVPKRRHEQHIIAEGDQIEIVTLVGGG
jgi:sulfur carrier protein